MMRRDLRIAIKIGLWLVGVGTVLVVGTTQFHKEYTNVSLLEAFYYSLRLFILEHDLPDFPKSPILIFIYFLAPLLALSAVGTAVSYLVRVSPVLKTRWQQGHIVVCGVGRTGKLLAETIRKQGLKVVGVDAGPADAFDEWCLEFGVPVIFGDFLSKPVFIRAGGIGARAILFTSGDDLMNLEGAIRSYGWLEKLAGRRVIWTHVSSENLARTASRAINGNGHADIRFFDTYHIAARKLVENHFPSSQRRGIDQVTIMGFGKFGKDLTEVLIRERQPDEPFSLRIIDVRDRRKEIRGLQRELATTEEIVFEQADMGELVLEDDPEKAFFICTDDDIGNLTSALSLTRDGRGSNVYVRMAHWPLPGMVERLHAQNGITFVNINSLVVEGLPDLTVVL